MKCQKCSKEIRDTAKVCGYCGHKVETKSASVCPECGKEHREGAKVCGYCGYKFESIETASEPAPAVVEKKPEPSPPPPVEPPPPEKKIQPPPAEVPEATPVPTAEKSKKANRVPVTEAAPPPATPGPRAEAESQKSGKRTFLWVLVPVILILLAGGFALVQTQGWFANEPFAGAIGDWSGNDIGDGSLQTLSIRRTLLGEYKIEYYDRAASACKGEPAQAIFYGETSTSTLSTKMEFTCESNPDQPAGIVEAHLTYRQAHDRLTDKWGQVWNRRR